MKKTFNIIIPWNENTKCKLSNFCVLRFSVIKAFLYDWSSPNKKIKNKTEKMHKHKNTNTHSHKLRVNIQKYLASASGGRIENSNIKKDM